MQDNKPWYKSRGVLGGAAATIAGVAATFGLDLDADQLTETLLAIGAAVGGIVAIVGRVRAKSNITGAILMLLVLGACTSVQAQIEEYGSKGFEVLENSSETALKAARRYICVTARVGPILAEFPTAQERDGWQKICQVDLIPIQ